jgi:hypothetical protein
MVPRRCCYLPATRFDPSFDTTGPRHWPRCFCVTLVFSRIAETAHARRAPKAQPPLLTGTCAGPGRLSRREPGTVGVEEIEPSLVDVRAHLHRVAKVEHVVVVWIVGRPLWQSRAIRIAGLCEVRPPCPLWCGADQALRQYPAIELMQPRPRSAAARNPSAIIKTALVVWVTSVRKWWNWQTHHLEGVAPKGVGVQIPPSAPILKL